jgi:hypothetical protein
MSDKVDELASDVDDAILGSARAEAADSSAERHDHEAMLRRGITSTRKLRPRGGRSGGRERRSPVRASRIQSSLSCLPPLRNQTKIVSWRNQDVIWFQLANVRSPLQLLQPSQSLAGGRDRHREEESLPDANSSRALFDGHALVVMTSPISKDIRSTARACRCPEGQRGTAPAVHPRTRPASRRSENGGRHERSFTGDHGEPTS